MSTPVPATDAEVPLVWQHLGVPGGVDIHTHFLPDRMQTKVWAWFDGLETGVDGEPGWPIHYRGTTEERLTAIDVLGLRAYTALVYAHKPDMAGWLTTWALDLADRVPGLVPGGTFFPEPGAAEQVDAALARGAKVFKVHVPVGGFDPGDPLLDDVWPQLVAARCPVVIHVGSAPMPHPDAGPATLARLLERFPDLVAVVAHLGMHEYESFIELAERYPDTHLDTAVVFTPFNEARHPLPGHLHERVAGLGHKIVLGSDFPSIPHDYATQIASLVRLGHGEEWLRAVLHDNGARLLGMTGGHGMGDGHELGSCP